MRATKRSYEKTLEVLGQHFDCVTSIYNRNTNSHQARFTSKSPKGAIFIDVFEGNPHGIAIHPVNFRMTNSYHADTSAWLTNTSGIVASALWGADIGFEFIHWTMKLYE